MKPTVHAWWQKMLLEQKLTSGTELQSVILQWLGALDSSQRRYLHWEFRSLVTDGTKCLNEIGRYVEK